MKIFKKLFLLVMFVAMTFVIVFAANSRVSADELDSNFETDYVQITFQDNELKVLLNGDWHSYREIQKSDVKAIIDSLKNSVIKAFKEDVNVEDKGSKLSPTAFNYATLAFPLYDVIISQVTVETVESDIDNGKYDELISYSLLRYLAINDVLGTSSAEDFLTELCGYVEGAFAEALDIHYGEYYDLVASYASSFYDEVIADYNNSVSTIPTLEKVTSILKVIENPTKSSALISSFDLGDEVIGVIEEGTKEQIVEFFKTVDSEVIGSVATELGLTPAALNDIVEEIGVDNVVDIIKEVSFDDFKSVLQSIGYTQDDFSSEVLGHLFEASIGSIYKSINSASINGYEILSNGGIQVGALEDLIISLPNLADLEELDPLEISLPIELDTIFGEVEFDLTVGFFGDVENIRRALGFFNRYVSYELTEDHYSLSIQTPAMVSRVLAKIANGASTDPDLKQFLFNATSMTAHDFVEFFDNHDLDSVLMLIDEMDYKTIAENVYAAQTIKRIFGEDDARLKKAISGFSKLIHKVGSFTYDDVKAYVAGVIDISRFDDTRVEYYVNRVLNLIARVDAKEIDYELLIEFVNPESEVGNATVEKYIDKLRNHANLYVKFVDLLDKLEEKLPEKLLNKDVLDYYLGDSKFHISCDRDFNLDRLVQSIAARTSERVSEIADSFFDKLIVHLNVDVDFKFTEVYKITYHSAEGETVEGLLPAGAKINGYAFPEETVWYDAEIIDNTDATVVEEMPHHDVDVYAQKYTEVVWHYEESYMYDATIQTAPTCELLDGTPLVVKEKLNRPFRNAGNYTFEAIVPAGLRLSIPSIDVTMQKLTGSVEWTMEDSYTYNGQVQTSPTAKLGQIELRVHEQYYQEFKNAGAYYFFVQYDSANMAPIDDKIIVIIDKYEGSVEWTYSPELIYNGNLQTLPTAKVLNMNLTVEEKDGKTYKDLGTYNFKALYDENNMILSNTEVTSIISKGHKEVEWTFADSYTYNGNKFALPVATLDGTPLEVAEVSGKEFKNAGTYQFKVVNFDTYIIDNPTCDITVDKFVTEAIWNFEESYIYNGYEFNLPTATAGGISLTVSEKNSKTFKDAGSYQFVAKYDTENMTVTNTTLDVKVEKAAVAIEWVKAASYIYNGELQKLPIAKLNGATLVVSLTQGTEFKNAGIYEFTALYDNTNYQVSNDVITIEIHKLSGIVEWVGETVLIYTGSAFDLPVAKVNGMQLVVNANPGEYKNLGTYTFTALYDKDNMSLSNTTFTSTIYSGTKQVVWTTESSYTYTGSTLTLPVAKIDGASVPVKEKNGKTFKDAGSYTFEIDYTLEGYNLTNTSVNVTVNKKVINVQWSKEDSYTYTGSPLTAPTVIGAELTVSEKNGKTFKDAGSYTFVATTSDSSIILENNSVDVTVNKKAVTLVWSKEESYTYTGSAFDLPTVNFAQAVVKEKNSKEFKNAGSYVFEATCSDSNIVLSNTTLELSVAKQAVEAPNPTWDYTEPFTATVTPTTYTISLTGVPALFSVNYENNSSSQDGNYHAKATLSLVDQENYSYSGKTVYEIDWVIYPAPHTTENATDEISGIAVELTTTTPVIPYGAKFEVTNKTAEFDKKALKALAKEAGVKGKAKEAIEITLVDKNGEPLELSSDASLKITLNGEAANIKARKLRVVSYSVDAEGNITSNEVEYTLEDNVIEIANATAGSYAFVKKNSYWWIILVAGIGVVAAGGAAAYYFLVVKGKKNAQPAQPEEQEVQEQEENN